MKILIVTPAKNEENNLPHLMQSLQSQSLIDLIGNWIIVNDDSTDNTFEIASAFKPDFNFEVINFVSSGSLVSGGAYQSWFFGLNSTDLKNYTHFMKLDADVELESTFFETISKSIGDSAICGGVLAGMNREQNLHVPGPAKIYSSDFFETLTKLPQATGFDVMDEVLARSDNKKVTVVKDARFIVRRAIGASEGRFHGRFRNGKVCRWTGYHGLYFFFHLIRYTFRRPYLLGAVWLLFGYIRAGEGPYSLELKQLHRKIQKEKLVEMRKNPISWLSKTYTT